MYEHSLHLLMIVPYFVNELNTSLIVLNIIETVVLDDEERN
jgi:hypothetical protein